MADWLYDVGAQDGDIAALGKKWSRRAPTRRLQQPRKPITKTRSAPTC